MFLYKQKKRYVVIRSIRLPTEIVTKVRINIGT